MNSRLDAPDESAALEQLHALGCTDGLPVVIPTPDRVDRMVVGPEDLTGDRVLPSLDDRGFLHRREQGMNLWLGCRACG